MTIQLERPVLVPEREVPTRQCLPALSRVSPVSGVAPREGGPLLLGWPVLVSCQSRVHNTLNAARKPRPERCVCPRAQELFRDFREKENRARNERRGQEPAGRSMMGRQVSILETINTASFLPRTDSTGPMPECRIQSLGGTLPDEQAEDFHAEELGLPSMQARARAKAVCRRCPLQEECLTAAVDRGEAWGIWGGLEPKERRNPSRVRQEMRAIAEGARA